MSADLQEMLGYLNFSSGATDVRFLHNLNELYRQLEGVEGERADTWDRAAALLAERLSELVRSTSAFRDSRQAESVLRLVGEHVLPAYRRHHADLLFHQPDAALWRPLLVARICEAVLRQGAPWEEVDRVLAGALAQLNDSIGYRPVAVLNNAQRMQPYRHEWIRPMPLFVRGAGVAVGRYEALVTEALAILQAADPHVLAQAMFDPQRLDELAFDPRAYDFDHPANRRPNYQFGWWDPNQLDQRGHYCRFVVQQVTLDAALARAATPGELPPRELLLEAAAVLAGTILMASGTSGDRPEAHDSSVTLGTLLPRITSYRDAFYEQFLGQLPGKHGKRLREEAARLRQPLGGARQHLNQSLSRMRAAQLEHVHLALVFARLGHSETAFRLANVVPAASARMQCLMQCRIAAAHLAIDLCQIDQAAGLALEIEGILHRAIECGALVDPWNILGFQGQFSLFPSPQNSIHDHRVDELVELVSKTFGLYSRVGSEAAARDDEPLEQRIDAAAVKLARWWDPFAVTTVEGVAGFLGSEAVESAQRVGDALRAWHRAGAAAADMAFWRKHVEFFSAPKAYALVVEALLAKGDLVAAMGLLVQWLSRASEISLRDGEHSFHELAVRWLHVATEISSPAEAGIAASLARKFFDYLEANADEFWQVPQLDLESAGNARRATPDELDVDPDAADEEDELYGAAYDGMVYRDTTDDGVDSEIMDSGTRSTDFELDAEVRRLRERLAFLSTLAALWKHAALRSPPSANERLADDAQLASWLEQAERNRTGLLRLLGEVHRFKVAAPSASRESLIEFERRRATKEALLEAIIATLVETAEAGWLLHAACDAGHGRSGADDSLLPPVSRALRLVLARDAAGIRELWPELIEKLSDQPLLYVPLAKGGDPAAIAYARQLQQAMRDLAQWLPRLGLVRETCQLLEAARIMESRRAVGPGAVTEFDRLFDVAFKALLESAVDAAALWPAPVGGEAPAVLLLESVEQLTESLQRQWLAHSRSLRLSVLERVADEQNWQPLVRFIERFGRELFTQLFMNFGSLRAILHQGVDTWLTRLAEQLDDDEREGAALVAEIDVTIPRSEAVKQLGLAIEAVAENYVEYRDYNTTTTQSDRGELLFTLLDFLRLRVQYDRVAWNLRPVLAAHEVLVRRGCSEAAESWRRAVAERTADVAAAHERRLARLVAKYGMRLATVADRVGERFVRPLAVDRVRALVEPAVREIRAGQPGEALAQLVDQTDELLQHPTGAGLDVPAWITALEEDVDRAWRHPAHAPADVALLLPQAPLSMDDLQQQLTDWERYPA